MVPVEGGEFLKIMIFLFVSKVDGASLPGKIRTRTYSEWTLHYVVVEIL